MRYQNIVPGVFLSRPNRFVAKVEVEGREETVHVKNTGRCRELLVPGCRVYLERAGNPDRKTAFDLVTVEKTGEGRPRLINMDAQAPNRIFAEWAEGGGFRKPSTRFQREVSYGSSRFDFYWEGDDGARGFVEVKGCTLEEDGWTYFPDAPTERGVKHLRELRQAREAGYEAAVCFVIQMEGVDGFSPNDRTHPAFGEALRQAAAGGVEVLAYDCRVTPDEVVLRQRVPVRL